MKFGNKTRKTLAAIFATAAIGGLGFGIYKAEGTIPSTADGISYLKNQGFTDVTPTDNPFFTGCNPRERAHTYNAVDKSGNKVKETVCAGLFHRIHMA
jgi:hypothetical protein